VDAEGFLLEHARHHDAAVLARLGRHLTHVLDPDRGDTLAAREAKALARRGLWLHPDDELGLLHGRFTLDGETGAALRAVLDPLAAPRPSTRQVRTPRHRPGAAATRWPS
jgi:hypothetical protein